MRNRFRPLLFLLVLALGTLPIQQFWIRPIELAGAAEWVGLFLTNWAAPVVLGCAIAALWRHRPKLLADNAIIAFFLLAAVPLVWLFGQFVEIAIGWRYTLFAMIGYWIGRSELVDQERLERWLRVTLWLVLGLTGVQFMLWLVGSPDLLARLGLEQRFAAGDWSRLYGPMSGPNQLGTFLALAGTWLFWRQKLSRLELLLVVVAVILTFSRSAVLGLAAGLVLPPLLFAGQWKTRLKVGTLIVGVAAIAVLAVNGSAALRKGLVEDRHADLRFASIEETADKFARSSTPEWLVGHGAGTAGPAADVLQNGGFIPENWFIQIAYEFGLLGLGLIAVFFGSLFWIGLKTGSRATVAIITLLVVNSLFLHPLSDNFAAAIWFYLLLGLGLTASQKRDTVTP